MKTINSSTLNKYIIATIAIYFIIAGGIIYFSFKYVDNKRNKLRSEAYSELQKIFDKQSRYVMIGYSGENVAYEKGELPKFDSSFMYRTIRDKAEWEERYGNLYKIYNLKPRWEGIDKFNSDNKWSGWLLYIIEQTATGFQEYQIHPRSVGYYRQTNKWMYAYAPSVQAAIDEAFEFHTTNPKSSYYGEFSQISSYEISNKVSNEYYRMYSYDDMARWRGKQYADSIVTYSNWDLTDNGYFAYPKAEDQISVSGGAMYNEYYRVENQFSIIGFWDIIYDIWNDPQAKDKKKIQLYGLSPLTVIFLLVLIALLLKKRKRILEENETTKQRLLRLCHPNNFTVPFNKEKIDKANYIYGEILDTPEENTAMLESIADKAINELGISFIEESSIKSLMKKCNPRNFMNPYNASKVALASELYESLSNPNISYSDLCKIKERLKSLL